MKLYDMHVHSHNSHDGRVSCKTMADEAIKRNLSGICFTDHYDCGRYPNAEVPEHIFNSVTEVKETSKLYGDEFEILSGIEFGDYLFGKEIGLKCLEKLSFDYILCSTHSAEIGKTLFNNFTNFRDFAHLSEDELYLFLEKYFECILNTITDKQIDYDGLAHLTYPLRYIVAINKKEIDISKYDAIITEILKNLIKDHKCLEINTSCLATEWKYTMPDNDILKKYYDLGGRLITIGSDSHFTERLGLGFSETLESVKKIGFENYYIYKERKPVAISL